MNKLTITLIIGLPGSGKTYLLNHKYSHCDIIDDIIDLNQLPSKMNNNIAISDVLFCVKNIRDKAILKLSKQYTDVNIECVYFENDAQKCLNNVKYRDDNRKVLGFIKKYSKGYVLPDNVIPLKIWQNKESS